ncbi:unnamed protein product, partial [Effrenium voratum]
ALTGAKPEELMKLMGMKARGEREEDIERSVLARLEVTVLGCCMQVQGAVAMEDKHEEKDGGGSYDHLKVFGGVHGRGDELLELLAAKAHERWGGPRIQSTRVEKVEEAEDWLGRVGGYIQEDHSSTTYGKGNGEDVYGAEGTVDGIEGSQDRDVDWVAVTKGYTKGYSKGYNKGYNKGTGKQDDGIPVPVQPSVFYTMTGEKHHARISGGCSLFILEQCASREMA